MKITEKAKEKLNLIIKENTALYPKLEILGGGCHGFQYDIKLSEILDSDIFLENILLIDNISFDIIKNSKLDYINDLNGSYFKLIIPESNSTCGCGKSFSI